VVLLIIWTIVSPYQIGYKFYAAEYSEYTTCLSDSYVFISLQLIFIFIIMIVGIIISIRVRKIKLDTINEVAEIFQSEVYIIIISVIVVPLSAYFSQYPGLFELVIGCGLFLMSLTSMFTLFGKKIYRVYRGKGNSTDSRSNNTTAPSDAIAVVSGDKTRNSKNREKN